MIETPRVFDHEKVEIMKKISFNKDWRCYRTGEADKSFAVTVPHDAMLLDAKSDTAPSEVNAGWIDARDYTYEKEFEVPTEYENQKLYLEFEGVYHKATVYINGEKAACHNYGYSGFYVDITDRVRDEGNTVRVESINSDQPNCRWYSGTGIYRPVWLWVLPRDHILPEGIRITTLDFKQPKIKIEAASTNGGPFKVEILDKAGTAIQTTEGTTGKRLLLEMELPGAVLWSPEKPYLYTCRITIGEDTREETFGLRMVEWGEEKGLCINGERVILKGACIHSDNGLLGACAYDFAEKRKIRILKENGYNAIRSAHNPCSKALLAACDEQGMLVMDEYVDVWYIHKNKYDYATEVEKSYKEDLAYMVKKDYNHPSVIMYSTGNEVAESAQKRGITLCKKMTSYLHKLDTTRPVSCGINIFFNFLSSMGFGVYSDKKAEQAAANTKKKKSVGSEFYNNLAGLFGSNFMKLGATLYPCDVKTRDAYAAMDIAGYNYGIYRYAKDLKKYPERLILGSETFCSDAYRFYELAKKEKRILGDFVWAGMDYLGEVGIGSWEYKTYAPDFSHGPGWVTAGSGRIDLTGKPLAEMTYTRVAFEQETIGIGVIPVKYAKQPHSPSAWKMTNAIESWSWNGCDGMKTQVEVYARGAEVELFMNGTCVGKKRPQNDCRVVFPVTYQRGSLKARVYDENHHLLGEKELKTAGEETQLTLEPELTTVHHDTDLCYVRLKYTDSQGEVKPLVRGKIKVSVQGGTLLGLGSACPYYPEGYLCDRTDTYYGEALAIIKPLAGDKITVYAESKYGKNQTEIQVI